MSEFADLHDDLRAVARDILAADADHTTRWRQAAGAGWLGLEVAESLDGSEVTFAETAVVLEELGRAAASLPFLGTAVLGVAAAQAVEPGEGRDALLRALAAGDQRAAVALAPHADAATPEAPFRLDRAGRLTGGAELVVDADVADHLLVLAESPDGLALVHLTRSVPGEGPDVVTDGGANGVSVVPQPVIDASRTFGSIAADGVPVAGEDVWRFAGDAAGTAQAVLDRAATAVAADAFGIAAAMLDATVAYVGVRRQFDRAIGSFQAVKHQCADGLVHLRLGRELLHEAIAAVAAGDAEAGASASRAKSYLGDAAVEVVGTAMQLHGGIGYTWESGIHRYLKRALLDRSLFGSPDAHRRRLAGHLWPE